MRRALLLALAAAASAEGRPVERILADHARALGAAEQVRTLVAVTDTGRACFRLPGTCRRDLGDEWTEWFSADGAFVRRRGVFERFRPNQRTTRGGYYLMKALAEPFPLLAYLKDPRLLSVGRADGYEAVFTAPDDFGVRTFYLLDPTTHLLAHVRFDVDDRPFAGVAFSAHRETKGVMLPHVVSAHALNFSEDVAKSAFKPEPMARDEHIRGWEVDPKLEQIDFVPGGLGAGGGKGFERVVVRTGPDPHELAAGDLDGDGRTDFAVACEGGVWVHFGGREDAPVFVELGKGHHHGLAIDDFDGDGRAEALTTSAVEPDRTFWFVSFDAARKPTVRDQYGAPHFTHALATDDFDYDGLPDVAATGFGTRDLAIRLCNGCMGFRLVGSQWPLALAGGKERGLGIATGDIDGDRMRDIAVATGQRVIVFRGQFNLAFQPQIAIPEEIDPKAPRPLVAVAFSDLDGDGRDDLLLVSEHPLHEVRDDVVVMMNRATSAPAEEPTFGFVAAEVLDMGERVQAVAAGALDAGAGLDLAATSFLTGELVLRSGDGKGGFGPMERFASGRGACRLALVDYDRDGRLDVLVSNRLDDSVAIFLNRRDGVPRPPPAPPRAVPAAGPVEEKFELVGLSEPYEFAGEFRLPAEIQDPSGIACLASTPISDQFVIVSDKRSALFRLTLDRMGKRLLVGPAVTLIGLERERLDLEAIAWDSRSGNLFLACERDSSVVRADLFGHVLGRVRTRIESDGNDGLEALAFRRLKDGTPLLYAFRERMGTSGRMAPFDVYGFEEDPFGLECRQQGAKLPVPLLDQADAVAVGERMFVVSRFTREIVELRFEGDLFAKEVRRASYLRLTDELLGLRNRQYPLFGNVEGIALDWNNDLFLLVDNNRETLGVPARNEGPEGRLLWFRCGGTAPPRTRPERVRAHWIRVPGGKEAGEKARALLARALKGEPAERLAADSGLDVVPATVVDNRIRPQPGEVTFSKLPIALAQLLENMEVGETALCEYDPEESPDGWCLVWRTE